MLLVIALMLLVTTTRANASTLAIYSTCCTLQGRYVQDTLLVMKLNYKTNVQECVCTLYILLFKLMGPDRSRNNYKKLLYYFGRSYLQKCI